MSHDRETPLFYIWYYPQKLRVAIFTSMLWQSHNTKIQRYKNHSRINSFCILRFHYALIAVRDCGIWLSINDIKDWTCNMTIFDDLNNILTSSFLLSCMLMICVRSLVSSNGNCYYDCYFRDAIVDQHCFFCLDQRCFLELKKHCSQSHSMHYKPMRPHELKH